MRRAGVLLWLVIATACAQPTSPAATSTVPSSSVAEPTATATATAAAAPVDPDPRVGAVFLGGDSLHTCSGSVLHSTTGDLVLTAAHCMADGYVASFAPGFTESAARQDFWQVDSVYLDPRWVASQDPHADIAVLRVSRQDGAAVEATTGGGFAIGPSPVIGTDVVVTGYALGVGGVPVSCRARMATAEHGYPSIRCSGLVDGTSGAPWLAGSTVVGITGGLEGGGCEENVSYAPPFDETVLQLVARAEAGGPGDSAPAAFDDC